MNLKKIFQDITIYFFPLVFVRIRIICFCIPSGKVWVITPRKIKNSLLKLEMVMQQN